MRTPGRFMSCLAVITVTMVAPLSADFLAAEPPSPSTQAIDGYGQRLNVWPRTHHTAIHDHHRDQMVIFGGHTVGPGAARNTNDTWTVRLTGTDLFEPVVIGGLKPPGRHDHSAIYDPIGQRMIIFGGRNDATAEMNDTWAYSFITGHWESISPGGTTPFSRYGHAAVYDPVRERMLIYGGNRATGALGDVWALALNGPPTWSQVQAFFPPRRWAHTAIYDAARDRMVVDGGYDADAIPTNDTWALDLTNLTWSELTHTQPVPAGDRVHHRAAYDAIADRMLVCIGSIWEVPFSPAGAWSQLAAAPLNYVFGGLPSMIHDGERNQVILHGGNFAVPWIWTSAGMQILSLATLQWSSPAGGGATSGDAIYIPSRDWFVVSIGAASVRPFSSPTEWQVIDAGTPPPFFPGASTIHDTARDQMIVFGGDESDSWALDFLGTPLWHQVPTSGSAPTGERHRHTAVHDALRDRMIIYGGSDGTSVVGDLRVLDLGTLEWAELFPSGPFPPDRSSHLAIMDPVGDRMIVFGGDGLNDVWALNLSPTIAWEQLAPFGTPPNSSNSSALYDPIGHRMIVANASGVWTLSLAGLPAWSKLTLENELGLSPLVAYDSARDRLLFQYSTPIGGHTEQVFLVLWALSFPRNIGVTQPSPANLSLAPAYPNPSSGSVRFQFHLARQDDVTLRIHDLSGRVVATLVDGSTLAGPHDVEWSYARGFDVAPGVYFADLRIARSRFSRRFVIVR